MNTVQQTALPGVATHAVYRLDGYGLLVARKRTRKREGSQAARESHARSR